MNEKQAIAKTIEVVRRQHKAIATDKARCVSATGSAPVEKICANCHWWGLTHVCQTYTRFDGVNVAVCGNPKLRGYGNYGKEIDGADVLGYETDGFETAPKFGCIHWQQIEAQSE